MAKLKKVDDYKVHSGKLYKPIGRPVLNNQASDSGIKEVEADVLLDAPVESAEAEIIVDFPEIEEAAAAERPKKSTKLKSRSKRHRPVKAEETISESISSEDTSPSSDA